MLNRIIIRRRQQISLLPTLITATTEKLMMPGNVAHVDQQNENYRLRIDGALETFSELIPVR